jgi:predicted membrane-bound dolichyl-phosphate-mannose-protein mannosyltransferase
MLRRSHPRRLEKMTDISITVALCLAALAMSLVLSGRVAIELVRTLSYSGMVVFGAHALGVTISAPIASSFADNLGVAVFVWLVVVTLAVCARGFRRLVIEKRDALNGS